MATDLQIITFLTTPCQRFSTLLIVLNYVNYVRCKKRKLSKIDNSLKSINYLQVTNFPGVNNLVKTGFAAQINLHKPIYTKSII